MQRLTPGSRELALPPTIRVLGPLAINGWNTVIVGGSEAREAPVHPKHLQRLRQRSRELVLPPTIRVLGPLAIND